MTKTRLEMLQEMVAREPQNTFVRYGLAQEYVTGGRLEEAAAEFARLREISPDYVAAYLHGGSALESLGRIDEARQVYQRGIEVCRRTGDEHARSKMQDVLDQL